VVLLKSSARCTSDGATSSSVREVSEILLVMVDSIVVKILVVVGVLFTKKWRIEEFEESHGGVRRRPNQDNEQPLVTGPRFPALPVWEYRGEYDLGLRVRVIPNTYQ